MFKTWKNSFYLYEHIFVGASLIKNPRLLIVDIFAGLGPTIPPSSHHLFGTKK